MVIFVIVFMQVTACMEEQSPYVKIEPAQLEKIEGSELNRVIMSEKAMERLAIETGVVREENITYMGKTAKRKTVDYSSIIYDPNGKTWLYTSPQPRVFVRQEIKVDFITGDKVVLNEGPEIGVSIATVGVAEIYGTEAGVGH